MSGGSGEQAVLMAACGQMGRYHNLPTGIAAGMADSKVPDAQSGYEKSLSITLAAHAGANAITQAAGMHAGLIGCALESYVIDNDTFGNLARYLRDNYTGADDKPTPINPKQLDETQNCPACFQKMEAHPYYGPGSVVIDSCNHCKLAWLDHGELGRIVRAPGRRAGNQYGR